MENSLQAKSRRRDFDLVIRGCRLLTASYRPPAERLSRAPVGKRDRPILEM